jgi:hypothetical protein
MAGRIFDRLAYALGRDSVFKDVDNLEAGENFPEKLRETISASCAFVPLMGEEWLNARDVHGSRRLDDPEDFVRTEIASALVRKGDLTVVPVLLYNATMPSKADLPPSRQDLADIHASRVRDDPDFHQDVEHLVARLRAVIEDDEHREREERERIAFETLGRRAAFVTEDDKPDFRFLKNVESGPKWTATRTVHRRKAQSQAAMWAGITLLAGIALRVIAAAPALIRDHAIS